MGTVVEMHILVSLSKAPGMDYWWPELCWVVAVNPEPCQTRATATVVYGGSGPDRQTRPRFPPLLLLLEVWVTETQDSQGDDCPMPHNPGYPWLPPLPPSCPPPLTAQKFSIFGALRESTLGFARISSYPDLSARC